MYFSHLDFEIKAYQNLNVMHFKFLLLSTKIKMTLRFWWNLMHTQNNLKILYCTLDLQQFR